MNAAIVTRGLATGWRGVLIAAVAVGAMLVFGLAVYQDFDLSIYTGLPEAAQALLGIPPHADAALLAYNEMLASLGALAFVAVAIAAGAQAVAGAEQDRTLHVTLATPVSRWGYVTSRAVAVVLLLVAAGALLLAVAEAAPRMLGLAVGDAHLTAMVAHLTANAIFHGMLALGIGAATGRRAVAAGVASAVMVFGWLAAGLLPIWREGAADWVPWYWFNGSKPLVNGVDAGQLSLLLGGAVVFVALGVIAFRRRELRLNQAGPSLRARLQALPVIGRAFSPTGRGTSLFGLRLASQQTLVGYLAILLGIGMGFSMPFLYNSLRGLMGDFAASFPQTMADLFGGGDLSTTAGFLHLETFGMMAPAAVIVVATAAAAAGIAGEERERRMSVLLAQPLPRYRVYVAAAATMAVSVFVVAAVLWLGSWAGVALTGLDVEVGNLTWACALLVLLGWWFGALALLVSAASGSVPAAVWTTTGVALASYFAYTLLLAAGHEEAGWWSPFRAYLFGPPLMHGAEWWQPLWLLGGAVVLLAAGLPLFQRRSIRA